MQVLKSQSDILEAVEGMFLHDFLIALVQKSLAEHT